MNHAKLIEKIQNLPLEKQAEVFDFAEFLASRCNKDTHKPLTYNDWTNAEYAEMSMNQAMRDMEDEPSLYTLGDLKERWQ